MDDWALLRYSRHFLLPEIGIDGQERIAQSTALVVGAGGGLGSAACLYLASAGVGTLMLVDGDVIELSNLQRQVLHPEARVGQKKVWSAKETLQAINPHIQVMAFDCYADENFLQNWVPKADVVLVCSDSFSCRQLVNRACLHWGKPLVNASCIRFEGQASTFDFRQKDSPCYHCLYPDFGDQGASCTTEGVFAPLPGIMGTIEAAEALKILAGMPAGLVGKLLLVDVKHMDFRTIRLVRDPACTVCAAAVTLS
jgi:adenylyltransferase/sulfurtransferase